MLQIQGVGGIINENGVNIIIPDEHYTTTNNIELDLQQVQINENSKIDLTSTTNTTAVTTSAPSASNFINIQPLSMESRINVDGGINLNLLPPQFIQGDTNGTKINNGNSSVICSVGLPKLNGKRKLDADSSISGSGVGSFGIGSGVNVSGNNVNGYTAGRNNIDVIGIGNCPNSIAGSDIKKARRVQNKARCQNSNNVISCGKITRSK